MIEVSVSVAIAAPVERVWSLLGGFDLLEGRHLALNRSHRIGGQAREDLAGVMGLEAEQEDSALAHAGGREGEGGGRRALGWVRVWRHRGHFSVIQRSTTLAAASGSSAARCSS